MKVPTIAEQWDDFHASVIPKNAPAIQIKEMRWAFYAGAASLLFTTRDVIPTLSDDAGVLALQLWLDEVVQFKNDVLAGKR